MIKPRSAFLVAGQAAFIVACAQQPGAAAASAQARAPQRCFLASQVRGFGHATDAAVDVEVGASRYYRLLLNGPCYNINWSTGLILRTTGGSDWICQGADAEIIVPDQLGARCLVTAVQPITKADWLARRR